MPEIARELKVDGVVEGSVLRADDRVRITLQLIEGESAQNRWSDSYDRSLRDVIALQAVVARAVARQIVIALNADQRQRIELAAHPGSGRRPATDAYDAYLKGRYHHARWGSQASLETAIRYYEEAIRLDPTFARASAALALAPHGPDRRQVAKAAAERAVGLDPNLPEAYAALGRVRMREWDWSGSEAAFKHAIDLDPNSPEAHQWYAELLRRYPGRLDEAFLEARRAEALDPLSLTLKTMVGWVLFSQNRYDEAMRVWDGVLELDPDFGLAIYNQGLVYAQKGLGKQVIAAAQRAAGRWGDGEEPTTWLLGIGYALSGQPDRAKAILPKLKAPGLIAALHFVLGDEEQALAWLERGYEQRSPGLPEITVQCGPTWFGHLCDHPRFRALRAKMGLSSRAGSGSP